MYEFKYFCDAPIQIRRKTFGCVQQSYGFKLSDKFFRIKTLKQSSLLCVLSNNQQFGQRIK